MKANGYGRIVNVASIAGKEGNPMAGAYSSSKAAVIGAHEGDRQGRRRHRHPRQLHRAGGDQDADARAALRGAHRLHDVAHPARPRRRADEVAALICWLASEEMTLLDRARASTSPADGRRIDPLRRVRPSTASPRAGRVDGDDVELLDHDDPLAAIRGEGTVDVDGAARRARAAAADRRARRSGARASRTSAAAMHGSRRRRPTHATSTRSSTTPTGPSSS